MNMKTVIINRADIPDWEYGDVCIKKYSFSDKMYMASLGNNVQFKDNEVLIDKSNIDVFKATMHVLCAGIHYVKDLENYRFTVEPHSHIDVKTKFFGDDNISFEAGSFLLSKVQEFNKGLSEEEKKKSSE
jgi:hypothetical protein